MSESVGVSADSERDRALDDIGKDERYDDRVDVDTRISNAQSLALIGRSLALIKGAKGWFFAKLMLALMALIPGLTLPYVAKILIDQVLLQKSLDDIEVPFPPHFMPFVNSIEGLAPMQTMGVVVLFTIVFMFFFGRGPITIWLGGGADSATTSESKLNAGGSETSGILGIVDTFVDIRLHQRMANSLRTQLFERLTRLPMSVLDDHRIGDSVFRVMYDAPEAPQIALGLTLQPLFAIVGVVISLYLIQYTYGDVSPGLVWAAGLLVPIGLAVTLPASALIRRVQQASRAAGTATTNAIEESMSNIAAVQSLGGMARESSRVEGRSRESYRRFRHVKLVEIGIAAASFLLTIGLALYVYMSVSDAVISGGMTPGDWGVLFPLALSIGAAGLSIGMTWINLQGNTAAMRRVFFFLDMTTEQSFDDKPDLAPVRQGVHFEAVDFDYPNGHPALRDINLDLRVGEVVAIVGPTGSGKTSLAYLIPGFYRPTQGRITIDAVDTKSINLQSLRAQVTYVFQEHLLLSESIRSNFQLVRPGVSDEEILSACETAGARTLIESLPNGLDTQLGRSGDTLSVGQKQRLCIARGLVRKTPILILDEPTAALDPLTENALINALRSVARDHLVVTIAHRLSTIRQADRIIFLENGRIRDIGTHDQLMAEANSRYRRFVELQRGDDHE